jgi:broad specificity phosphatase PhoE
MVVVTHDAVIRAVVETIDPARRNLEVPTGSWCELVRSAGSWTIGLTDQKPVG